MKKQTLPQKDDKWIIAEDPAWDRFVATYADYLNNLDSWKCLGTFDTKEQALNKLYLMTEISLSSNDWLVCDFGYYTAAISKKDYNNIPSNDKPKIIRSFHTRLDAINYLIPPVRGGFSPRHIPESTDEQRRAIHNKLPDNYSFPKRAPGLFKNKYADRLKNPYLPPQKLGPGTYDERQILQRGVLKETFKDRVTGKGIVAIPVTDVVTGKQVYRNGKPLYQVNRNGLVTLEEHDNLVPYSRTDIRTLLGRGLVPKNPRKNYTNIQQQQRNRDEALSNAIKKFYPEFEQGMGFLSRGNKNFIDNGILSFLLEGKYEYITKNIYVLPTGKELQKALDKEYRKIAEGYTPFIDDVNAYGKPIPGDPTLAQQLRDSGELIKRVPTIKKTVVNTKFINYVKKLPLYKYVKNLAYYFTGGTLNLDIEEFEQAHLSSNQVYNFFKKAPTSYHPVNLTAVRESLLPVGSKEHYQAYIDTRTEELLDEAEKAIRESRLEDARRHVLNNRMSSSQKNARDIYRRQTKETKALSKWADEKREEIDNEEKWFNNRYKTLYKQIQEQLRDIRNIPLSSSERHTINQGLRDQLKNFTFNNKRDYDKLRKEITETYKIKLNQINNQTTSQIDTIVYARQFIPMTEDETYQLYLRDARANIKQNYERRMDLLAQYISSDPELKEADKKYIMASADYSLAKEQYRRVKDKNSKKGKDLYRELNSKLVNYNTIKYERRMLRRRIEQSAVNEKARQRIKEQRDKAEEQLQRFIDRNAEKVNQQILRDAGKLGIKEPTDAEIYDLANSWAQKEYKDRKDFFQPAKRLTISEANLINGYTRPIVVFDTETDDHGDILSISAIKGAINKQTGEFVVIDTYEHYYHSKTWKPSEALQVNGLTKEIVDKLREEVAYENAINLLVGTKKSYTQAYLRRKTAKDLAKILKRAGLNYKDLYDNEFYDEDGMNAFKKFAGKDAIFVGHNINKFDIPKAFGPYVHVDTIDTLIAATNVRRQEKNHNTLSTLFEECFGKTFLDAGLEAHKSSSDIIANLMVFMEMYSDDSKMGRSIRYILDNLGLSLAPNHDLLGDRVSMVIQSQGLQNGLYDVDYYDNDSLWEGFEYSIRALPNGRKRGMPKSQFADDTILKNLNDQIVALHNALKDLTTVLGGQATVSQNIEGFNKLKLADQWASAYKEMSSSYNKYGNRSIAQTIGTDVYGMELGKTSKFMDLIKDEKDASWRTKIDDLAKRRDDLISKGYLTGTDAKAFDAIPYSYTFTDINGAQVTQQRNLEDVYNQKEAVLRVAENEGNWRKRVIMAVNNGTISQEYGEKVMSAQTDLARWDVYSEGVKHMKDFNKGLKETTKIINTFKEAMNPSYYDPRQLTKANAEGMQGAVQRLDFLPKGISRQLGKMSDIFGLGQEISIAEVGRWVDTAKGFGTGLTQGGAAVGSVIGLGISGGNPLGGAIGGAIGSLPGMITNGVTQWQGNRMMKDINTFWKDMQMKFDMLGMAIDIVSVPFKLLASAAKSLTNMFKGLGVSIKQFMSDMMSKMSQIGTPITGMTGIGREQYQRLGVLDSFFGFGQGSMNSSIESLRSAQLLFMSMGRLDENKMLAAFISGVGNEWLSGDFNGMINNYLTRGDVTPEAYAQMSQIDPNLPRIIQQLRDIGITDIADVMAGRYSLNGRTPHLWEHSEEQQKLEQQQGYEYSILSQGIQNAKMLFASNIWEAFGANLMGGLNDALNQAVRGDWAGAWKSVTGALSNTANTLKNFWDHFKVQVLGLKPEDGFREVWTKIKKEILKWGDDSTVFSKLGELFKGIVPYIKPVIKEICDLWVDFLSETIDKMEPLVLDFIDALSKIHINVGNLLYNMKQENNGKTKGYFDTSTTYIPGTAISYDEEIIGAKKSGFLPWSFKNDPNQLYSVGFYNDSGKFVHSIINESERDNVTGELRKGAYISSFHGGMSMGSMLETAQAQNYYAYLHGIGKDDLIPDEYKKIIEQNVDYFNKYNIPGSVIQIPYRTTHVDESGIRYETEHWVPAVQQGIMDIKTGQKSTFWAPLVEPSMQKSVLSDILTYYETAGGVKGYLEGVISDFSEMNNLINETKTSYKLANGQRSEAALKAADIYTEVKSGVVNTVTGVTHDTVDLMEQAAYTMAGAIKNHVQIVFNFKNGTKITLEPDSVREGGNEYDVDGNPIAKEFVKDASLNAVR